MRNRFLAIGIVGSALFLAGVLMGQTAGPAKAQPPSAVARLAAAERVCQMLHDEATGAPRAHEGVEHSYLWSKRRMEAQRDVDAVRGDRFSALEAHLQRMHDLEAKAADLYKANVVTKFELASTQYYVAEAEEMLGRERAK